jgi:hypothetical protein
MQLEKNSITLKAFEGNAVAKFSPTLSAFFGTSSLDFLGRCPRLELTNAFGVSRYLFLLYETGLICLIAVASYGAEATFD